VAAALLAAPAPALAQSPTQDAYGGTLGQFEVLTSSLKKAAVPERIAPRDKELVLSDTPNAATVKGVISAGYEGLTARKLDLAAALVGGFTILGLGVAAGRSVRSS